MKPITKSEGDLSKEWTISSAARLGSSVRSKGVFLEVRARLPVAARKSLTVKAGELILRMPGSAPREFSAAAAIVSKALEGIERLPVIPREIEDILAISSTERRRWLKDGRLPSAGTRTVKLRGRARSVTFHVFEPRVVQHILDRNAMETWREEDAEKTAENRRRAAWKAKLSKDCCRQPRSKSESEADRSKLRGWAEFERDGPLR